MWWFVGARDTYRGADEDPMEGAICLAEVLDLKRGLEGLDL